MSDSFVIYNPLVDNSTQTSIETKDESTQTIKIPQLLKIKHTNTNNNNNNSLVFILTAGIIFVFGFIVGVGHCQNCYEILSFDI